MCEEININVNETNENINIISTEIVEVIDINVGETIEEVTLNITEEVIQVNINKVTGGGGNQDLQSVTDNGNTTTNDISLLDSSILLDNGSRLKKGTTDAGNGGNKGIALKCSLDYELKWEAGRQYIMEQDGITIREVSHNFTNIPTATDDDTKGFVANSRWILDNGDVYLCNDATTNNAVWELVNTGTIPTLQQVTAEGNETSNPIKVIDLGNASTQLQQNGIVFEDLDDLGSTFLSFQQNSEPIQQVVEVRPLGGTMALLSDIPNTNDFVPYTGATTDVDLGEYELKAGQLTLDTTPTGTATVATTRWNDSVGVSETTLKGGSVILKNGIDLVARVVNKVNPNTTLTKANYQVVRISGAQGQRLAVSLAQANNDNNSADTLGIVIETIAANQEGFIMTVGQLEGINTTGSLQGETWSDGDVLYLSPTTAGRITNIKPTGATGHIVILGYVEHAHITQGKIYVKIMNGWELDELHNVSISTPLNNQGLVYETSTDLWKNKTIDKTFVGLGNVDNTSDANKPISTATQTALNNKENTITAGTTSQYYRGDKTFQTLDKSAVGLGNVDNTSDANKPVSTAQLTAINAKVSDSITDGVTTIAPSQNAVFDALALKQNILGYTPYRNIQTSQTVHTGTTVETLIFTATIPANTFNSTDIIKVLFGANKSTALGTYSLRLRVNTTNTISGAPTIALYSGTATAQVNVMMRNYNLNGGNLYGFMFTTSGLTDIIAQGGSLGSTTLNPANQFFIFATITLNNSGDSIIGNMLSIHN